MLTIEQTLLEFIRNTYDLMQWPGVVALMAIESASIPLPSEIIMPLAGWMLVREKSLSALHVLSAGGWGALGCTIGSLVAYYVGARGGRPLLERWGKYVLVSRHDLEIADRWFSRRGHWIIFGSRLLPVIRTFISLPAGIARMNVLQFTAYTFAGSFIWCAALAWGGYLLGEHWEQIRTALRPFDIPIIVLVLALVALYIYRHVRYVRSESS